MTKRKICAVVKANAYGHGAEEVANALSGVADFFAVALVEEGIALKVSACGKEVLVFTPPLTEEEVFALATGGCSVTIPDLYTARLVKQTCAKYQVRVRAHLKVNTGMNRYGMNVSMLGKVCQYLQDDLYVEVAGIYSHLYGTKVETAQKQKELFANAVRVGKKYFSELNAHLGGTFAALLGEEYWFDSLRIGIGLYGYLPCTEIGNGVLSQPLKKAMTVTATTVADREYHYGGVGYGENAKIEGKRLSVCRFGYADGFLRQNQNGILPSETGANTLCMDVSLRWDAGKRGEEKILLSNADEVAEICGTISYEVLCAATRRAEFVYDYE